MSHTTPDMMPPLPAPAVEPSATQPGQALTEIRPRDPSTSASVPKAVGPGEAWTWADAWAQGAVDGLNRMRIDEAYRREIAARAK